MKPALVTVDHIGLTYSKNIFTSLLTDKAFKLKIKKERRCCTIIDGTQAIENYIEMVTVTQRGSKDGAEKQKEKDSKI